MVIEGFAGVRDMDPHRLFRPLWLAGENRVDELDMFVAARFISGRDRALVEHAGLEAEILDQLRQEPRPGDAGDKNVQVIVEADMFRCGWPRSPGKNRRALAMP